MAWFTSDAETYSFEIVDPDDPEQKATVTCRRLNADDHAKVVDSLNDDERGEGETRMIIVGAAIVSWSLEEAYSPAMLRGLDPRVFLQIWAGIRQEDVNPFGAAALLVAGQRSAAEASTDTASPAPAEPADDVGESPTS